MVSIREGLNAAMVRHGNRGHSPFLGPLDDILYLGYTVHIAHLCVAVKLHPLFQAVVHPPGSEILRLLNSHDRTQS